MVDSKTLDVGKKLTVILHSIFAEKFQLVSSRESLKNSSEFSVKINYEWARYADCLEKSKQLNCDTIFYDELEVYLMN